MIAVSKVCCLSFGTFSVTDWIATAHQAALLREAMTPEIKVRLGRVRDGLRGILDLLSKDPQPTGAEFHLEASAAAGDGSRRPARRAKA